MSLHQLRVNAVDNSFRYLDEMIERYQPTIPEWHRGLVWTPEQQAQFLASWQNGDVPIMLSLGRTSPLADNHVFLDGLNSFHSIRLAINDGRVNARTLGWHINGIRIETYEGTPEQLRNLTYLMNRGSVCPWTKAQLPR